MLDWLPTISVGICGVVIAVGAVVMIFADPQGWKRFVWAAGFVILGIGEVIAIKQAEKAHETETKKQNEEMGEIRNQLAQSELARKLDSAYMKAKLEDTDEARSQYRAIMRLAQISEENIRKQYETKVLSNNQLRDFTADVVKRMRALSYKHKQISDQQFTSSIVLQRQNTVPQKADQLHSQQLQQYLQEHANLEYEFKSTVLGDAIYARDELLRKVGRPQSSSIYDGMAANAFEGFLAGPDPVGAAADYLERLAKQLSP